MQLGKYGGKTVFVLQVHCKGGEIQSTGKVGAGSTQTWQLKKRYGYFERVDRFAATCAAAAGEAAPSRPRRKLLNHRDPKYLQALREELQLYLERVIELVQRTGLELPDVLQKLELPVASESLTWEQRSRFGVAAGGKTLAVELEGFLRKQGGSKSDVKRGFKERWFVLTGSSLHYYVSPEAPQPKGTIELALSAITEAVLGEERFAMVVKQANGREVKLAAASATKRSEWLAALAQSSTLPPSPPPAGAGAKDKRIAQLEASRLQTQLANQVSIERHEGRTLTQRDDEAGGPSRLELIVDAQGHGRQWEGFTQVARMHIHVCTCTCTRVELIVDAQGHGRQWEGFTQVARMHTCMCTCTRACAHVHVHVHTCMCMCTRACACAHVHVT